MILQLLKNDINGRGLSSGRVLIWMGMLVGACFGDFFTPQGFQNNWLLSTAKASTQDEGLGQAAIELINGTTIKTSVQGIASEGQVAGDAIPPDLNIRQVLSIKTARKLSDSQGGRAKLTFVGGGELWIDSVSMADEKIKSESALGTRELPLELLRAIVWTNSPLIDRKIKAPSVDYDAVFVNTSSGERMVEGILEAVDSEFIRIKYKGESKKIGLGKVKAIVTADLGLEKPDGAAAAIQLTDGSLIVGKILELEGGVFTVGVTAENSVQVPAGNVVSIVIQSDRLRYLSDQEPVEVQEKSIFAFQRPWKRNVSVTGKPLENDAGFDRFSAIAGIAAETNGRGDCQMIVRGDGIELWSERVTGEGGPLEIDVDIEGLKEIVLVVSPGAEFDLGDHANWGEARFIKTK